MIGHLDRIDGTRLQGWARDTDAPEHPVTLLVLLDGTLVARVLANAYRRDVEQAGFGRGRHGFAVKLDGYIRRGHRHVVDILREPDGARLPGAPWTIEPNG